MAPLYVFYISETACCTDQCTSSVLNNSICFEQICLLFMLLFNFHLIFSTWSHSFPLASTMATNPQYLEGCAVHTSAWRSVPCACYTLCGSVCFRFVSRCVQYVYLVWKYVEAHVCILCGSAHILCGKCVLFMEVCIQGAACKSGLLALIWPSMPTRARSAHPIFMTKPLYEFATSILKRFLIHSVSSGWRNGSYISWVNMSAF